MREQTVKGAFGRPRNQIFMAAHRPAPRLAKDYESTVRVVDGLFVDKPWPFARRLPQGIAGMWSR
jgi:hypothetical protein